MIITNSYRWKCDIVHRNSFNVCDLVVMIVISDRQSNVPKAQSKSEKNREHPSQPEIVIVGGHDLRNARY